MFLVFDKKNKGYLTFNELSSKLSDFGLSSGQVEHLTLLMDNDADGQVSIDEFESGYARFKSLTNHEILQHPLQRKMHKYA